MQAVTTIGLDIAKSVFQVHGVDAHGKVVVRRQLKRRYVLPFFKKLSPCLVGIEACATSHHWSRELQALGHTVRLMPPAYVKLSQAAEERCCRCGSDLRSCCSAKHAVRRDQDSKPAKLPDASSHAPSVRAPAECGHQFHPGTSCRAWHRSAGRAQRRRGTARCCG